MRFLKNGLVDVRPKTEKDSDIAKQNEQNSPLLHLPSELRLQIYSHVLGGEMHPVQRSGLYGLFYNIELDRHALALLSVGRHIHTEAALLLFSQNTFSVNFTRLLDEWVSTLEPAQVIAITNLHCYLVTRHGSDLGLINPKLSNEIRHWTIGEGSFAAFKSLRHIQIQSWGSGQDEQALLAQMNAEEQAARDQLRVAAPDVAVTFIRKMDQEPIVLVLNTWGV